VRSGALLVGLLALGLAGGEGAAQRAPARTMPDLPLPVVSVLTIGQGNQVFERFGHNALRIWDTVTGEDLSYNWGMFSFDQPRFLRRFLSGDTRYWVEAIPTAWLLQHYAEGDRRIDEQVLALTPEETERLVAFVRENVREENRYYRYDYFRDNCSTRLRDALDHALGGALHRRYAELGTTLTYRDESVRLTARAPWAQAGIDIALGPRADRPITAWESMFIPMRLRDHLREVTLAGAAGSSGGVGDAAAGDAPRALVRVERVLFEAKRAPELAERRGLTLGAWGPILAIWMLILTPWSAALRARLRVPAAAMAFLWYGVTGLLGAALLGMWLGSAHVFWYGNWNLLLLSPLGLVAAFPVARAVWSGRESRVARILRIAMPAQVGFLLLLAPFVGQGLWGPFLLFGPAHLALGLACWRHLRVATQDAVAVPSAP
jgi:hypothetical protein